MTTQKEKKPTGAKHSNQALSRESHLRYLPGGFFLTAGAQTNVGVRVGRRPYLRRVASVSAPPGSTPGAEKIERRELSEEIERRKTRAAPAQCLRPEALNDQADQDERWGNDSEERLLSRSPHGSFPTEIDPTGKKMRAGQKDLREAQLWRGPSEIAPSSGENNNGGNEIELGSTSPASPRLFAQRDRPPT